MFPRNLEAGTVVSPTEKDRQTGTLGNERENYFVAGQNKTRKKNLATLESCDERVTGRDQRKPIIFSVFWPVFK